MVERQQELTTEVIGYLTEQQRAELGVYGWEILQAQNLDLKNPNHVTQVEEVLLDCLQRGLLVKGKLALSKTELVGPIFEEGLKQREKLISTLKTVAGSRDYNFFLSQDALDLIFTTSPLAANLGELEQIKAELAKKEATILKLHSQLFDQSALFRQAARLKSEIKSSRLQDTQWQTNTRLFANFLTHLALYPYQRPSLEIEPKDLAALGEMWANGEVRLRSQDGLLQKSMMLAEKLGVANDQISKDAIKEYTRDVIGRINSDIYTGTVDLNQLVGSFNFAISPEIIQSEVEEFEVDTDETIYLSPKEVQLALDNVGHYLRAHKKNFDLLNKGVSIKKFKQALKELRGNLSTMSGLELILILTDSVVSEKVKTVNESRDLRDTLGAYIPKTSYISALKFAYADNLKFQDSSETILAFQDEYVRARVKELVGNHVIEAFKSGKVKFDALTKEPSINFLADLLNKMSLKEFSRTNRRFLKDLDEEIFLKILFMEKVNYTSGTSELVYPPGAEYLKVYFDILSKERQQRIKNRLMRQIQI